MRGHSGKGLLELGKGHLEAADIVGSVDLLASGVKMIGSSGLTLETTAQGSLAGEAPEGCEGLRPQYPERGGRFDSEIHRSTPSRLERRPRGKRDHHRRERRHDALGARDQDCNRLEPRRVGSAVLRDSAASQRDAIRSRLLC